MSEGTIYDIPLDKVQDFLNDMPEAIEIKSFRIGMDTFNIPLEKLPEFLKNNPNSEPILINKSPTKELITQSDNASISNLHFQVDKIKVGKTDIELPFPSGFVKVDDSMDNLLEAAKKLCPKTNTLLAYYISEEDYANYLVDENHVCEK